MRKFVAAFVLAAAPAWSATNILSNTDHIVSDAVNALAILGTAGVIVNQTCATGGAGYSPGSTCGGNGSFVEPGTTFASYAANTTITLYAASTATPVNHAPYSVLTQSSTGYALSTVDQMPYNTLETAGAVYNMAYCGGPGAGDAYPPVAASTILPSQTTVGPLASNSCGYAIGVEFSMTPGYKGFDTGSPSGTTEAMAAVLATLQVNHPTWTWGDIKGALRQTADGWAAGYAAYHASPLGFGYGNIDFDAATAVASPSAVYLEAPGMTVAGHQYYATITIYPFITTRRAKEVVYVGGTWPAASSGNELTAAQIASAGGTKIIDDGGATGAQSFTYAPAATGSATFTVLTLDSSGNGSRVEVFSRASASFIVGTACLQ